MYIYLVADNMSNVTCILESVYMCVCGYICLLRQRRKMDKSQVCRAYVISISS